MKKSPRMRKLEEMLRSSVLVVGGFMGNDRRPIMEVIEADGKALSRLRVTAEQVAERMQEIQQASPAIQYPVFQSFSAALRDTFRTVIANPAVGVNAGCEEDLSHLPGMGSDSRKSAHDASTMQPV